MNLHFRAANDASPGGTSEGMEEAMEKTAGQDSSSEAPTASTDEWKPTAEDLEQATPESDNQGRYFAPSRLVFVANRFYLLLFVSLSKAELEVK